MYLEHFFGPNVGVKLVDSVVYKLIKCDLGMGCAMVLVVDWRETLDHMMMCLVVLLCVSVVIGEWVVLWCLVGVCKYV